MSPGKNDFDTPVLEAYVITSLKVSKSKQREVIDRKTMTLGPESSKLDPNTVDSKLVKVKLVVEIAN